MLTQRSEIQNSELDLDLSNSFLIATNCLHSITSPGRYARPSCRKDRYLAHHYGAVWMTVVHCPRELEGHKSCSYFWRWGLCTIFSEGSWLSNHYPKDHPSTIPPIQMIRGGDYYSLRSRGHREKFPSSSLSVFSSLISLVWVLQMSPRRTSGLKCIVGRKMIILVLLLLG